MHGRVSWELSVEEIDFISSQWIFIVGNYVWISVAWDAVGFAVDYVY